MSDLDSLVMKLKSVKPYLKEILAEKFTREWKTRVLEYVNNPLHKYPADTTGTYRESIGYTITENGFEVGSALDYAEYVERGRRGEMDFTLDDILKWAVEKNMRYNSHINGYLVYNRMMTTGTTAPWRHAGSIVSDNAMIENWIRQIMDSIMR